MSEISRPVRSQYEDFMRHVYTHGTPKTDRTGTGTRSVFGYQMRFDLNEGFPLVTTKKVHLKSIIQELLWFLQGSSDNNWLQGARRHDLGRMGRARTATWARSTACSGAAGRRRTAATSTRSPRRSRRSRPTPIRAASSSAPGTWPTSRRWRWRPATRSSSSTCAGRQAVLPALPAQRRHLPGRALQHRQLRAAHPHDGAAVRPGRGRLHLDRRRLPHLQQPPRAGGTAAEPRSPTPIPC